MYARIWAGGRTMDCASHRYNVVSGIAEGIDWVAYKGALAVGGKTTAILGRGVNVCYPKHHLRLHAQILESGGLISGSTRRLIP